MPNFHIVEFEILTIEVVWIAEGLDELALDFETPLRFLGRIEVQRWGKCWKINKLKIKESFSKKYRNKMQFIWKYF